MMAGAFKMPMLSASSWAMLGLSKSTSSRISVKGRDRSGWITSAVKETRLILASVRTMDGEVMIVLTIKMLALFVRKVTGTLVREVQIFDRFTKLGIDAV